MNHSKLLEALNNRDSLFNCREKIKEIETNFKKPKFLPPSEPRPSSRDSGWNRGVCEMLDYCNVVGKYEFRHALHLFGEYRVNFKGFCYYLDGLDIKKQIIFEYDERGHQKHMKDLIRSINLVWYFRDHLGWTDFTFIRYAEYTDEIYRIW